MKMRSWLLPVVAAFSGLAILATPAQAGGKKHHRHHYWEDEGRYRYYNRAWDNRAWDNRAWDNRGYRYYRPYYREHYREPYYYGPVYDRGPVLEFRLRSN